MTFKSPIVADEELLIPGIRSEDYIEGEDGWRIARDGTAQLNNAHLLGDLGTNGQISADSFQLGPSGLYLPDTDEELTEILERHRWDANPTGPHPYGPNGPKGLVGYYLDTAIPGTFSTVNLEQGLIAARFHEELNRMYMVMFQVRLSQSVAADTWFVRIRRTQNNTVPGTSNTSMGDFGINQSNRTGAMNIAFPYISTGESTGAWIGAFLFLAAGGTGTAAIIGGTSNPCFLAIIDIGPRPGFGDGTNAKRGGSNDSVPYGSSYAAPITIAPPAPKTYTTSFQPAWSRSYDGDSSTTWDDSAYCFQGRYDFNRENTRSLVGYDYAAIQAALAGATVNSVKFTYKVNHTYASSGSTIVIGAHNYTSKPSTWNGANVAENQIQQGSRVAGSTYTVTLPAAFGTNFKSGAWRGMAFGPGPSTSRGYYAYMYGATQSGKPYLTFTYTK